MPCITGKCGSVVYGVKTYNKTCDVKCAPVVKNACANKCKPAPCDVEVAKVLVDVAPVSGVTGLAKIYSWDVSINNKSQNKISSLEVIDNFGGLKLNATADLSEINSNFTSVTSSMDSITVYDWADIVANGGALVNPCKSSIPACSTVHLMVRIAVADYRVGNDGTQASVSTPHDGCNEVTIKGKFSSADACGCCVIECPFTPIVAIGQDCCGNVACLLDQRSDA